MKIPITIILFIVLSCAYNEKLNAQFPNFRIHPSANNQIEPNIVTHPMNPDIMFASAFTIRTSFRSEGVYLTTNGGLNWSESNPGFSTTVDIAFPDKNTWYTVCDRNISYPIGRKYENLTSISVNVNSLMEGFWNGKPLVTDTVTVELHSASSPYALVDQAREVVNINGYATYEFYTATAGSYYIVVKHRNSLETWSSAPVAMTAGGNYNYDFTTAATQAYGSNMVYKLGSYCMYSGDVDQDDIIDAFDLSLVENNIGNSGYINPDVTGDDYVDGSDVATVENNQGIIVAAP